MEKRRSNITKIILIIVAVLAIILIILGVLTGNGVLKPKSDSLVDILDEESEEEDEGKSIFMIPKDDVYEFTITDSNGIILKFSRSEDGWIYADDEDIKLNQERMDKVLNYLCDIKFIDSLKGGTEDDYNDKNFGLNADSVICSVTDYNGYTTIVCLGNYDEEKGVVYYALNYDYSSVYTNSGKIKKVCEYSFTDLVGP